MHSFYVWHGERAFIETGQNKIDCVSVWRSIKAEIIGGHNAFNIAAIQVELS